jgi:hypothetical protein
MRQEMPRPKAGAALVLLLLDEGGPVSALVAPY